MTAELQDLLVNVVKSGWTSTSCERLAMAIEERVVATVPIRLRVALGGEEAAQIARYVAWERCMQLAATPDTSFTWGYLANAVRWRLKDAVRADVLRNQRNPLVEHIPEFEAQDAAPELGSLLDQIAMELRRSGLAYPVARRYIVIAGDGPRYERALIRSRLINSGASRSQAEGFAWLLRGGSANPSALERLAGGQRSDRVFDDPVVRRWVRAAAGKDLWFTGGRAGTSGREGISVDLARSA
ncbi:hypothetical protein [Kribbella ginsengisoli]|uniref:Sigma-70 family RNA polymerase sigma factor n=1 Tax=Kribbella ginsengisoli TaxID=363865 RepID=A0ABP6Z675_9ACTN